MNKKKILKVSLLSLLAIVVLALVIQFFYLPRYWNKNVTVEPCENSGEELTIMSANVRCYSPTDRKSVV